LHSIHVHITKIFIILNIHQSLNDNTTSKIHTFAEDITDKESMEIRRSTGRKRQTNIKFTRQRGGKISWDYWDEQPSGGNL